MKRNPKKYNQYKETRCKACGHDGSFYPLDIDHVATFKAHPELAYDKRNLLTVCRKCHVLKGQKGTSYMAEAYPAVRNFLIANGWYYCELSKKWRLENIKFTQAD